MKHSIALIIAASLPTLAFAAQSPKDPKANDAHVRYIVDVEGKKVRSVGPRFLPSQTIASESMMETNGEDASVAISTAE